MHPSEHGCWSAHAYRTTLPVYALFAASILESQGRKENDGGRRNERHSYLTARSKRRTSAELSLRAPPATPCEPQSRSHHGEASSSLLAYSEQSNWCLVAVVY